MKNSFIEKLLLVVLGLALSNSLLSQESDANPMLRYTTYNFKNLNQNRDDGIKNQITCFEPAEGTINNLEPETIINIRTQPKRNSSAILRVIHGENFKILGLARDSSDSWIDDYFSNTSSKYWFKVHRNLNGTIVEGYVSAVYFKCRESKTISSKF